MSDSGFNVVGIGELLWDEFPEGRQLGGAPANFAYHCRLLGAQSHIVSAVGNDEQGQALRKELAARNLDSEYIQSHDDHPTGTVSVSVDTNGTARYVIHEDVAWDFLVATEAQHQLALMADAVCFGTLAQRSASSRSTIRAFLAETRPECLRVVDLNLRQSFYSASLIEESLSLATVLKLNEDELQILRRLLELDQDTVPALDSLLTRFDLSLIALSRADRGCILHTDAESVDRTGLPVSRIQDTVGAGDCFTATLTVGLLRNEPLGIMAEQANRRAAYVCTQPGAMPDMSLFDPKNTFDA